jgi:hypothetical protein
MVVWPEAKVIIAVRPEAEIFEPGWHRVICVPPYKLMHYILMHHSNAKCID